MNICSSEDDLIQQLRLLECQFHDAIRAGADSYSTFSVHLKKILGHVQQLKHVGQASSSLLQVHAGVTRALTIICSHFIEVENGINLDGQRQAVRELLVRSGFRRRHKRSTRSRKSKAGKNGRVRQSGKKSKRGRKSPVGNPKRRVSTEPEPSSSGAKNKRKPIYDSNGKKCRTVTAPPTDSMKFGKSLACYPLLYTFS